MTTCTKAELIVLGVDPGKRNTGLAVLREREILLQEVLVLPSELTQACAILHIVLNKHITTHHVTCLAFEEFGWEGHATSVSAATLNLTGVIRSCAAIVPVLAFRAVRWQTAITGQAPPPIAGRPAGEWKRIIQRAVCLHLGLNPEEWGEDEGSHKSDAVGIALYAQGLTKLQWAIDQSERKRDGTL